MANHAQDVPVAAADPGDRVKTLVEGLLRIDVSLLIAETEHDLAVLLHVTDRPLVGKISTVIASDR